MYYYIFDSFLNNPQYEKQVQDINASLNELTVQGERARVSPVRRLPDIMRDAFSKKIETIVMIGNETSLAAAVPFALHYNFILGYFPIDPEDALGKQLGVDTPQNAGRALAARRIEQIYPLSVNNEYFLTRIDAQISSAKRGFFSFLRGGGEAAPVKILFDENFFVSGDFEELTIFNTPSESSNPLVSSKRISPSDRVFEVAFKARLPKFRTMKERTGIDRNVYKDMSPYNLLKASKIEIVEPHGLNFVYGSSVISKAPCVVTAAEQKLKLIVGRNREF